MKYVGRNQLDETTLNRFAVLPVDYDIRIENGVCPDKDTAGFLEKNKSKVDSDR